METTVATRLGEMHAHSFAYDPKHLGFVLRRYHFVARMLRDYDRVLEVGCGDCTGASIVKAAVGKLVGCDERSYSNWPFCSIELHQHDMLRGPLLDGEHHWNGIYALDVLEHVPPEVENLFLVNINNSLGHYGTVIIGTPSLESQPYATALSRQHHVNCKTGSGLLKLLRGHYHSVYMLGLNDYALHDGFDQMVHYRLAVCTGKRY